MSRLPLLALAVNLLLPAFSQAQTRPTTDPWADAQELTRRGEYAKAIPILQKIAATDTANLAAALQLAIA